MSGVAVRTRLLCLLSFEKEDMQAMYARRMRQWSAQLRPLVHPGRLVMRHRRLFPSPHTSPLRTTSKNACVKRLPTRR
ncbi:hypothetical protein PSAB6_50068 [Paraburkholderia sabiae]|nr:hypothetical protein PSAB6_50068 [Paraburkholderia sabiae]